RSSLMMKLGMTTFSGSFSAGVGPMRAIATKSSTSLGRVCLSMKERMGIVAFPDRGHDEEREEQREADDDLVRRRALHAEGGTDERKHNHNAREAGHQ